MTCALLSEPCCQLPVQTCHWAGLPKVWAGRRVPPLMNHKIEGLCQKWELMVLLPYINLQNSESLPIYLFKTIQHSTHSASLEAGLLISPMLICSARDPLLFALHRPTNTNLFVSAFLHVEGKSAAGFLWMTLKVVPSDPRPI